MKTYIFYCLLISVLLPVGGCGKKKQGIRPGMSSITEAVYASGKIKAEGQYQVLPVVSGLLSKIWVRPGDTVEKNQILFSIENLSSSLNSENARLALELSESNSRSGSDRLQELEQNVNLAREKYELDSVFFLRQKNLMEQNIGTRAEFDNRKMAFNSSKSAYFTSRNRLNQIRIQLKNELERARIGYRLSEKQKGDFMIRSEFDGLVYDVYRSEGELVSPQTPLAVVGKINAFYPELQVNESDIARLSEGQRVEITMDGYKGEVFEAVITRIYPIMNERTRNFRVDARFVRFPSRLFPNMNVEANIVLAVKKNAITIPRRYLLDGNQVLMAENQKKEVKTGIRDFEKVEILSGLDTTMEIFLP